MSEARVSRLHLSYSRKRDLESLPDVEAFFEDIVVPNCADVALGMDEGSLLLATQVVIDRDEFNWNDVEAFLSKRAKSVLEFSDNKLWKNGEIARSSKLLIYIGEDYGRNAILIITTQEAFASVNMQFPILGKVYCFNRKKFLFPDKIKNYEDCNVWEVKARVKKKCGENSECYRDIERLINIVRDILFGELRNDEITRLVPELTLLRVKLGSAAIRIISDFATEAKARTEEEMNEDYSWFGTETSPQDLDSFVMRRRFALWTVVALL